MVEQELVRKTRSTAPTRLAPGSFFGVTQRSLRGAGLILSETHYPAGLDVPRHVHELPYFSLLLAGAYYEQYGSRRVDFDPFSVVFQQPRETRRGHISESGARLFHVELAPGWMERLREHGCLPEDAVDHHSGDLVWLSGRLYREFRASAPGSPLVIEGLTLEMLGVLARRSSGRVETAPDWLKGVVERLREDYSRTVTVSEIASELDVSPVRLSRVFRRFLGESIGEYHRRNRIEEASRLLEREDLSLGEVALECGFADQSHLTRIFKRLTGETPGSYRRTRMRPSQPLTSRLT